MNPSETGIQNAIDRIEEVLRAIATQLAPSSSMVGTNWESATNEDSLSTHSLQLIT